MTGKRKGKGGQRNPYRGPWPEDHATKYSGRKPKKDEDVPKADAEDGPGQPNPRKAPQNAPK